MEQETKIPEDVQQLQTFLQDVVKQRNALQSGTFSGKVAQDIAKLDDFLRVSYQQVFNQYNNHPFIVEMKKKQEEAQASKTLE